MTDKQNNPDPIAHADRLHAHAESLAARQLAASPTPPAEQPPRWVERWHGSGGKEFWEGWSILNAANRKMIAHLGPDVDPDAVRDIVAAHNEALCGECAGTGGRWCPACAGATPPAEQQVIIDFALVGTAGPFPVVNGRVKLPDATMQDLVHMLRPTYDAEQAAPKAAPASVTGQMQFGGCPECGSRSCMARQCSRTVSHSAHAVPCVQWQCGRQASGFAAPQQEAPKAAPVKACVCGEPQASGTVHRVDGPCYVVAPQQEAQEPYAYAVYFPDQPKVELVHDLDELIDDLTNRPHVVTKLYTAPRPAPAPLSEREAFEAWIKKDGGDLGTFGTPPNMHYRNSAVNNAWVAWKARAAMAARGGQ